jgi:hypothetical protein
MLNVGLRGAENHSGGVPAFRATQQPEEFDTVYYWHVPIEQNNIGHPLLTLIESDLAIFGLVDFELEAQEDPPDDLPDRRRIVDYQAQSTLHLKLHFQTN